mmetsp:Transcript_2738/g.6136  ORF Transcript_2738/g.6136 Transcript_2738/m.6136 type:complete len:213 (+) Transcript_2738:435-1073(+)
MKHGRTSRRVLTLLGTGRLKAGVPMASRKRYLRSSLPLLSLIPSLSKAETPRHTRSVSSIPVQNSSSFCLKHSSDAFRKLAWAWSAQCLQRYSVTLCHGAPPMGFPITPRMRSYPTQAWSVGRSRTWPELYPLGQILAMHHRLTVFMAGGCEPESPLCADARVHSLCVNLLREADTGSNNCTQCQFTVLLSSPTCLESVFHHIFTPQLSLHS